MPVPGASAPLAALVGSGLQSEQFRFCGFLPSKTQARQRFLEGLCDDQSTLLFFESPARLKDSLKAMGLCFGSQRQIVVAREMTKLHEAYHRGTADELVAEFASIEKIRGEIVIVVAPVTQSIASMDDAHEMLKTALGSMKTKQAANHVAEQTGLSKQALYKEALSIQKNNRSDES